MARYFTGINSKSFLEGFDPESQTFDKRKLPESQYSARVYLTEPVWLEFGDRLFLLKSKFSARRAITLTEKHGGIPIVLECGPDKLVCYSDPENARWCYSLSPVRVNQIYKVERKLSFLGVDIAYVLKRMEPKELKNLDYIYKSNLVELPDGPRKAG